MKSRWSLAAAFGLAVVVMVTAADLAPAMAAVEGESRIEVRTQKPGQDKPEVRVWVNGKQVEPGGAVALRERAAEAERPALGVMVAPLSDEAAAAQKVKAGVQVMRVFPGSPAATAEVREGDVITAVDGKPVKAPQQLADMIQEHRSGDRVRLTYVHDGKSITETVVLTPPRAEPARPRPEGRPRREGREGRPGEARPEAAPAAAFLGVMVTPLTEEMMEIAKAREGVLVDSLVDNSPAAKAGLQPGDVITAVDGRPVKEPEQFVGLIRGHKPGDRLRIAYSRMGQRSETMLTLGARPEPPQARGGPKEGVPLADIPEELFKEMPQLRDYLEKMRPQLEDLARRFGEGQMPPGPVRPMPPGEAPRMPRLAPPVPAPKQEPYDLGKDMGRLMERLDRIEKRLDTIERRLNERAK